MVERARIGALDHLGLAARATDAPGDAGVWLGERRFRAMLNLRGAGAEFLAAVEAALGVTLPVEPNTTAALGPLVVLWLGPDEWLIVSEPGSEAALQDKLSAAGSVTDVGEARTTIVVSGPRARDVLAKGCPLDLHPRAFKSGQCAQSLVGPVGVILRLADGGRFELVVLRSFADYLWRFLEDAGQEYGVAVVEA